MQPLKKTGQGGEKALAGIKAFTLHTASTGGLSTGMASGWPEFTL